ncbi:transcriptional regulator, y4mF family [Pseudomonas putida]|nr:transcriptional regulator, y4mF family [Pseudomonas putida]CAB5677980.1 transcriptional regulator, y4mF family [Pseudomonas putida]CAB5685234.1 transcriptional regulator, y4mF family [Pseudomonas putida]CAB5705440.1 transcriptional regulator, y4mF family [Pseudomonas putida]CAC9680516.1 transcriptional regulator, y4mF family [Pseudomonas putida]
MQTCAIGERLREERERFGWNQEQLGQLGGVNRNSQGKYEKGERTPDATYLSAIAAAGVDVLYVVTGARTPAPLDSFTAEETAFVQLLRSMDESDRAILARTAQAFAKP